MPAQHVGGSPRDGSGYARLAAMAKDQESICSQLMATAKAFEAQLVTLRAEHQALRRCLDRSGVLPADELEKELQSCPPPACTEAIPSMGSSGTSTGLVSAGVDSSCTVTSRPCSLLPQEDTAATAATAATTATFSPAERRRTSDSSPCRAMSPAQGGYAMAHQSSATALSNGVRALSPHLTGTRGRSPNKSCERAESTDGRKGRPRSRSGAMRAPAVEEPEGGEAAPEGDLYELMSKLLDQGTSVVEQQRAVRSVQQLLKRSAEPPNAWNGPGTPLSAVVRAGRSDLARLLLRARANVNERDAKGVSALHVATYDGNAELCRVLLVARADVDACDRHGQTPLFFVPNRDICKLLIERRSDVTVLNRKGQSALHLAGRAGLHEVLAWLSTRVSKALADLKDVHGATARAYALQSGVPKPEASSPRSSRGRRAGSPRVPSRAASPQAMQRTTSPARGAPPLRGGGGTQRLAAAPSTAAPERTEALTRNDVRRGSGQLPYVSELVEGRTGSAATGCRTSAGEKFSDGCEKAAPSAQHAAAVLEAAAAVATAAVATAAELEAAQKAEAPDEAGSFDQEADTWPVRAEAELDRLKGSATPAPVARGPGAIAPGAQETTPEVDLSEIGVINETAEDLAELGVCDGDNIFSSLPAMSGAAAATGNAVVAEDEASAEEDDALPETAKRAADSLEDEGVLEDESDEPDAAPAAGGAGGAGRQEDEVDEGEVAGAVDDPPKAREPMTLARLEDELDEVF
uniref:Uncharacterized protein n=1 Tax=Alexandrium monilatum TaxID=311494 RepID=A0A7S4Q292_9DINO